MPNRYGGLSDLSDLLREIVRRLTYLEDERARMEATILALTERIIALEQANEPAPPPQYPSFRDVISE